ncbi:MAG: hypothetical protein LUQ39_08620 [Methanomassiliicoccales archaeon]|nr:hypothetical protein [Methanomassiliicoccales archaeon]
MISKGEKAAAIIMVIITIAAVLVVVLYPSYLDWKEEVESPVHEGDYIEWTVSGTRNGVDVTGTSKWTFSNVTSHANVFGMEGWPKYDMAIRTTLNGVVNDYYSAGAYQDKKMWSLGINPAGIEECHNGYYNLNTPAFERNETLSTVFGQKSVAVYIQRYNFSSNDFWSEIWIDVDSGMPYKMEVTEPPTLNGYPNEFCGTLTFQIMATNMIR